LLMHAPTTSLYTLSLRDALPIAFLPGGAVVVDQAFLERADQFLPVGDPRGIGGEPVVGGEARLAQGGGQPRELPVVAAGDGEQPVPAAQCLVRGDRRVAVAHPA